MCWIMCWKELSSNRTANDFKCLMARWDPSLSAKTSTVHVRERPISPMNIDYLTHSASVLVR